MRRIYEYGLALLFGGTVYSGLEILFRGFTHWTMFFAGGICFSILYHIFTGNKAISLWKSCLIGALVITGVEFAFGCVFNLALGWNVWDYSNYPLHLLGQVCLVYTLLWFLLSAPIYWIARGLNRGLKRRIPHRYLRS